MTEILLIDGSYYIFYRYHALIQWWKHSNKDDALPENPCENVIFMNKFKSIFLTKIEKIKKKTRFKKPFNNGSTRLS